MSADPAVIIKDILVTASVGAFGVSSAGTWGIFIGRPPLDPTPTVVVNVSGGRSPWPHFALNYPSIQCLVRGAPDGYVAAQQKARDIVKALLGYPSTTVGGVDRLVAVNQIGDVSFVGYDERNCPMFSANFSLIIESLADNGYRQVIT